MQDEKDHNAPNLLKASGEHYWEWLLHEDDLFSSRINFFLIAESMLFIAFAINAYGNANLTTILGIAGILFISIWLYVSIFHIYFVIKPIKERLREKLPEYGEVKDVWLFGNPNIWLGIVFPLVLIGIWIFLIMGE